MLQVGKKRGKPGRKWILWLAVLALAAAGVFLLFQISTEEPLPVREDFRGALMDHEPSEIRRIRIQLRDQTPWTAVRNAAGDLELEGEEGMILDSALGERIEDALAHLMYEEILTEDPSDYADRPEEFGLDHPALIAEAEYTDGSSVTLRIGDGSGLEDRDIRFMTVDGDPRLYAVAGSLMDDLGVEQALLHPVTQPEIQAGRVDRITVRNGEGVLIAEWALEGAVTDADAAANWMVTYPFRYPADQDLVSGLKKNAANLRLGMYVCEGTEQAKAEYGLETPQYDLEIHLSAGTTGRIGEDGAYDVREWEEESLHFLIGNPRSEMTDYCLFGGTVYTLNHFTVSSITGTDPIDTAARYPVTVPLESLSSMEIVREDGGTVRFELTRFSEPAEEEGGEERTVTRCLRNGEELPWTVFEAAYERWLVVNVSGRLPESWQKKETREKYIFRTVSGREHAVELSEFDAMHDAVTVDGCTLFYLIRNGMGTIPE